MRGGAPRAALIALLLLSLAAGAAAAQEEPYANETNDTGLDNWTQNRTQVDVVNVSHYISRVGTFVVGRHPGDPGIGPMFVGMMVAVMGVTVLGQSKAGLVAGGTMGVFTVAALSAPLGAGLLPRWLYGVVVMLIAFVVGVVYIRVMR
jgi:hypothetical protein